MDQAKTELILGEQSAGQTKTKAKQARKRVKKRISEADLRRSVQILTKGEGTKLYTPKKDPKPKDQTSQAAEIARKLEDAAVLKALANEAIVITPLLEEQLAKVNRFCTGILTEVDQAPPMALDGNMNLSCNLACDAAHAADPPEDGMAEEEEQFEEQAYDEEPEEEEKEMEDAALEPTEEGPLELGESVLDDINLDSDEDLLDDEGEGGDASL